MVNSQPSGPIVHLNVLRTYQSFIHYVSKIKYSCWIFLPVNKCCKPYLLVEIFFDYVLVSGLMKDHKIFTDKFFDTINRGMLIFSFSKIFYLPTCFTCRESCWSGWKVISISKNLISYFENKASVSSSVSFFWNINICFYFMFYHQNTLVILALLHVRV